MDFEQEGACLESVLERWLWQAIQVGETGGRGRNEAGSKQFKQNEIRI